MKKQHFDLIDLLAGRLDESGKARLAQTVGDHDSPFSMLRRELRGELLESEHTEPDVCESSDSFVLKHESSLRQNRLWSHWIVLASTTCVAVVLVVWLSLGGGNSLAVASTLDFGLISDLLPQEQSDHWTIAYRQPPRVTIASIGPDDLIAYADDFGSLRVRSRGRQRNQILLPAGSSIQAMTWNPVHPNLLTASGSDVTLWKLPAATGEVGQAIRLTEHNHRVNHISVSADGRRFASLDKYGTVCIWDSHGGLIRKFVAYPGTRNADSAEATEQGSGNRLFWSPDSNRLLTLGGGDSRLLKVWTEFGEVVAETLWEGDSGGFGLAAWTNDGTRIATTGADHCVIWEVTDSLVPVITVRLDDTIQRSHWISWVDDTEVFVAHGDASASFVPVDGSTVSADSTYDGHALAWHSEGTVVMADTNSARLVVASDNGRTERLAIPLPKTCTVRAIERLVSGDFVAGDCSGRLHSFDAKGIRQRWPNGHEEAITDIAATSDGATVVSADVSGRVLSWTQRGSDPQELQPGSNDELGAVQWVRLSPNERFLAVLTRGGALSVFSRRADSPFDSKPILETIVSLRNDDETARHQVRYPNSLEWISDTRLVVGLKDLGGMQTVSVTGELLHIPAEDASGTFRMRDHVSAVSTSSDGSRIFVGSSYGHLGIWQTDDMTNPSRVLPAAHSIVIKDIERFAEDSEFATCGVDGVVCRWKPDGTLIHQFPKTPAGPVRLLRASPDGQLLAAGDDAGNVWIWDQSADRVGLLKGHMGGVTDLEWSADSQFIAVSSGYGLLRVWDLNNQQSRHATLIRPNGPVEITLNERGQLQTIHELRELTITYRESHGTVKLTPVD